MIQTVTNRVSYEFVVLAFIATWGVLTFILPAFTILWDQTDYLATAEALLREGRLETANDTPSANRIIFRLITAALLAVDKSLVAFVVFVQSGSFLLAGVLYAVMRRYFGVTAALGALILFVTSPVMALHTARHFDGFWPALVLAATLVWIPNPQGASKGKHDLIKPLLSGALLGLAIGIKEVALLVIPVWLIMAVGPYWRSTATPLAAFGIALGSVLVCVAGISALFVSAEGEAQRAASSLSPLLSSGGVLNFINVGVAGVVDYFVGLNGVFDRQPLSVAGVLATVWLSWRARTDRSARLIAAFILTCIPLIGLSGAWGLRPGQTLLFAVLWRAALAIALSALILQVIKDPRRLQIAATCAVFAIGASQWIAEARTNRNVTRQLLITNLLDNSPVEFSINEMGSPVAAYFVSREAPNLIVDPVSDAQSTYRIDHRLNRVDYLPWLYIAHTRTFPEYRNMDRPPAKPVFIYMLSPSPRIDDRNFLLVLDIEALAKLIEAQQIGHLVLQSRRNRALIAHLETLGVVATAQIRNGQGYHLFEASDFTALAARWNEAMIHVEPSVEGWVRRSLADSRPAPRRAGEQVRNWMPFILEESDTAP